MKYFGTVSICGDPKENRTPDCALRGRRLNRLTIGPRHHTLFKCMKDDTIRFLGVQVGDEEFVKKYLHTFLVSVIYFTTQI